MRTCAGWLAGLMSALLLSAALHAQVPAPTAATNPWLTLPVVAPPVSPAVKLQVQQAHSRALDALLAYRFVPTRFDIEGVHALRFALVGDLFKPLVGRQVRVADLIALTDKINTIYREHGYALCFGFMPGQDFKAGVVRVVVVEGYVADVQLAGDTGTLEPRIRAIAHHIANERPLRTRTFQRYIQILGLLPGVTVNANVPAPTTTDGATHLALDVKRRRVDVSGGIDFNHPGTQGLLSANFNALTTIGEQLSVSALYPPGRGDQHFYSAGLMLPIGAQGWSTRIDASRYDGRPDIDNNLPSYLHRTLEQDRLDLGVSYPLLLGPDVNRTVSAGVYSSDESDHYLNVDNGAWLNLDSDIRVVHAEWNETHASAKQSRQWSFGVARGMDALGAASRASSNIQGASLATPSDIAFTRFNASFLQNNAWPARFGTSIAVTGQYSQARLRDTEKISFGGSRYGLAYDPGDASGDSGWGATFELHRSYTANATFAKALVPYVSLQWARVFANQAALLIHQLGSAALGLRVSDNHYYSIDLSIAQPIGDKPPESDHRSPRANLSFSYKLD